MFAMLTKVMCGGMVVLLGFVVASFYNGGELRFPDSYSGYDGSEI